MSEPSPNLIYGLIDPRTLLIRYVGLSSTGMKRPRQHAHARKKVQPTHCQQWIKALQLLGLTYDIVVLEELEDADALDESECWWIAFGRACGWPLTNLTEGGVPSAETIERRKRRLAERARRVESAKTEQHRKLEVQRRAKLEYETASIERIRRFRALIYPPTALALIERTKILRSRSATAVEQLCFQLFEKHVGSSRLFIEVVRGARVTVEDAKDLYKKWLRLGARR